MCVFSWSLKAICNYLYCILRTIDINADIKLRITVINNFDDRLVISLLARCHVPIRCILSSLAFIILFIFKSVADFPTFLASKAGQLRFKVADGGSLTTNKNTCNQKFGCPCGYASVCWSFFYMLDAILSELSSTQSVERSPSTRWLERASRLYPLYLSTNPEP